MDRVIKKWSEKKKVRDIKDKQILIKIRAIFFNVYLFKKKKV